MPITKPYYTGTDPRVVELALWSGRLTKWNYPFRYVLSHLFPTVLLLAGVGFVSREYVLPDATYYRTVSWEPKVWFKALRRYLKNRWYSWA